MLQQTGVKTRRTRAPVTLPFAAMQTTAERLIARQSARMHSWVFEPAQRAACFKTTVPPTCTRAAAFRQTRGLRFCTVKLQNDSKDTLTSNGASLATLERSVQFTGTMFEPQRHRNGITAGHGGHGPK